MAIGGSVHWHEGLFLRPQHLQMMQHEWQWQFGEERRLGFPYPYGVVEARLSAGALENLRVQFDRLRVVMRSGLVVDVPDMAELPALDIQQAFASGSGALTILLGVPVWYVNRANTIGGAGQADSQVRRLYAVSEVERLDENTGEDPQPVQVRRLNARLLLDTDDRSDLDVLPLVRIVRATGQQEVGLPRADGEFIPPCLVLQASPALVEMVRGLANEVEAQRKQVLNLVMSPGFDAENVRGRELDLRLRLRTLSRFGPRLAHLARAAAASPFEVYLELRALQGEVAALRPSPDAFEAADYDHDNPAVAFSELAAKIPPLLPHATEGGVESVKFVKEKGLYRAALEERHFTLPNQYLLGVRSKENPRAVAALVEDGVKFKLMPLSMATKAVFGVKVTEERVPPAKVSPRNDTVYFRLDHTGSAAMWNRVKTEKKMTAWWSGAEQADWEITLFMLIPQGK